MSTKTETLPTPVEYLKSALTLVHQGLLSRQFVKRIIAVGCEFDGDVENGIITIDQVPDFAVAMSKSNRVQQAQVKIEAIKPALDGQYELLAHIDAEVAALDALKSELDELKALKKPKDEILANRIKGLENTIEDDELRLSGHAQWKAGVEAHIATLESQIATYKEEQAEADAVLVQEAKTYTFKVD
jgi:hypothetical protein